MYYTVVNHKDTAEDGSVVLNYRKILMNAARKLGYVKKSAQTVFLENILADGKGSAETALKQIGRDGRCDEELLERLIERLFHLSDIDEIRRCEQEIERHLICVMKQNDQNASKKDKKAAKKYVRPKIGEFILEESKINGGFMRLERQIIFDKLKLFIDLTKLLSEEQLKELKDGISDKTAKWLLYERICDMLSNNSEAGGKNKIYLQIFEACKKSLPSSKKCTAKVLEALTDNKISVNTKGLTESSNLPSIMLALCKYEKGFAEEFGSLFGLNNLADHIEFYYKHSIFEAFDKTFGLRELFAGNFKGCIKDLAQSERCRSKDIIDQVYEDAFGDNYEEMLSRHEAISFDPAQMREEEALALQEQLNMQGLYREKIFVVNYRDKYKNITLRGSAT